MGKMGYIPILSIKVTAERSKVRLTKMVTLTVEFFTIYTKLAKIAVLALNEQKFKNPPNSTCQFSSVG